MFGSLSLSLDLFRNLHLKNLYLHTNQVNFMEMIIIVAVVVLTVDLNVGFMEKK